MNPNPAPTVTAAFAAVTSADSTRPLVTYFDDATGERTELSGATIGNWVSKTANLLTDGLGLGAGDVATVALPPHWQTGAILLGCWSAGLAVQLGGGRGTVAFSSADSLSDVDADDTYALALAPMALPFRPGPPEGTLDYGVEVRGQGDHFAGPRISPSMLALVPGITHGDLVTAAGGFAIAPGARVLIDADAVTDPVEWLVAPLLAGASVVLCRHLDPARVEARLRSERAVRYP